jgi:hypothetical protein
VRSLDLPSLEAAMRRLLVVVGLTVALLVSSAVPASAHAATHSWSDNHQLCNGCAVQRGNIVGMWQAMMWSSLIGSDCGAFVDGIWGPNTRSRTITWQRNHGLTADGIVGPQTWAHAQSHLYQTGADSFYDYWAYPGSKFTLRLRKDRVDGWWQWRPPTNPSFNGSNHPAFGPHGCA